MISSGFTLLEMIVVMLLLAIVVSVGVPRIFKGLETTRSRNLLSDMVMFLRESRMDAISSSKNIKVIINLEEGEFEADNDKKFSLPNDSSLKIEVEDEYLYVDIDETSITFFPNGMAASGEIIVLSGEKKIARIYLDPLTGLANYSIDFD